MFYLICFGDHCFSVFDFDEQAHAENCAEKWVNEERFSRVILCESLGECILKDEGSVFVCDEE